MLYLALKTVISAVLIVAVSEIAKRSPAFAALVASLPLISVLGMIWLWQDTKDAERMATHAQATFFYVLPSLPMFLLIPVLLRSGLGFYAALGIGMAVTVLLYLLTAFVAARFGLRM